MYSHLAAQLARRKQPVEIIVSGLGFMGFGFISSIQQLPGMRVALVLSRRPGESVKFLNDMGLPAAIENDPGIIKDNARRGKISVSDDTDLVSTYDNNVVMEVTGTIPYATDVTLKAFAAQKHVVTMNPELQVTVGSELKRIADSRGVIFTDVIGDQPGSLSRLVTHSRFMGFKILLAGNMKRFMNLYATQKEMKPWAEDKGLAVRQTVSFTDGTKQAIEMSLVSNFFGMDILKQGMTGPKVETVQEALTSFPWDSIPREGIVDYLIGKNLFPGIFVVAEHTDKNQQKYLRYLGLGDGPRYVLFEPYHLCHLEVAGTIAHVVLNKAAIIHNSTSPRLQTFAYAKRDLVPGDIIDGIGGDTVYGSIDHTQESLGYLPVGLSHNAKVTKKITKDERIPLSHVDVDVNSATKLAGLLDARKPQQYQTHHTAAAV